MRALERAGVPSIMLKGASVARWLYEPEDARIYMDSDLLVPSARFRSAVEILETLGFQPELDEAAMPSWWREHALTMTRSEDGAIIDLHRTLPGAHVPDEQLWRTLSATTDTIALGEGVATVLNQPGRALHATLHAAQHGGSPHDLDVLSRLIDRMSDDEWRAATELAASLRATAAFQRGLGFLPAGVALAQRLGLNAASVIDVELRAARAPEALTVARLFATRGLVARAAVVRHKLAPPRTFMQKWSRLARRGPFGLVLAYLWRPLWVIWRLLPALRAWTRARRGNPY